MNPLLTRGRSSGPVSAAAAICSASSAGIGGRQGERAFRGKGPLAFVGVHVDSFVLNHGRDGWGSGHTAWRVTVTGGQSSAVAVTVIAPRPVGRMMARALPSKVRWVWVEKLSGVDGVAAAEGLQHAGTFDGHGHRAVESGMHDAVDVGQREVDVAEVGAVVPQFGAFDVGVQDDVVGGAAKRRSAGLDAVRVGDRHERSRTVGRLERGTERLVLADAAPVDDCSVEEEFDLVRVAVDLDADGAAFESGPRPAADRVRPRPGGRDRDRDAVHRGPVDGDVWLRAEAEHGLAEVGDGPAGADDVDVAAPRGELGEAARERRDFRRSGRAVGRLRVSHRADAGLAEVVPAGPGEVADDARVGLARAPSCRRSSSARFRCRR